MLYQFLQKLKQKQFLLSEPFTSFLVRTAASWINCLMASFVFSSSSAFCFSLNRAWRERVRTDTHFSGQRDEGTLVRRIIQLNRLRRRLRQWEKKKRGGGDREIKEDRVTWSFCSAASSATWTLSLTLARASYFSSSRVEQRDWSSPTFLSHTVCSLRTASASWEAALSLAKEEKRLSTSREEDRKLLLLLGSL